MKKLRPFFTAAIGLLLPCALIIVPVLLSSLKHQKAQPKDTLELVIDYSGYGEFFEIGRDIAVSLDSSFSAPLRMGSCTWTDGKYVCTFALENQPHSTLDTVYIRPPILYTSAEIPPVSLPLLPGETAESPSNTDWFSIRSADAAEHSDGFYRINVLIEAHSKDLPHLPKLCIGEDLVGGRSSLSFDENGNFSSGEFEFLIHAGSQNEAAFSIADASLVVSSALLRVDAENLEISSNASALSIIVREDM